MTSFTYKGYFVTEGQSGPIRFEQTDVTVVVPDHNKVLRYTRLPGDEFITILSPIYTLSFAGQSYPGAEVADLYANTEQISWGNGKVSNIIVVTPDEVNFLIVQLSGDCIPVLTSLSEYRAFVGSVTQQRSLTFGNYGPDRNIPLANLPGGEEWENDVIVGTSGNDVLYGGLGQDHFDGRGGNDTIYGGAGDDIVIMGEGSREVWGGAGNDSIGGGTVNSLLAGGDGNDVISAYTGNTTIWAGAGNDFVTAGSGVVEIWLGTGDSTLDGATASGVLGGGSGNDLIFGGTAGTGMKYIWAGAGNDTVEGSNAADQIGGGLGQDSITAGAGADLVWGADGNDVIYGGLGNDTLYGGEGTDTLHGDAGDDTIYLSAGNDVGYGGAGNDRINAGTGNDTVTGGDGADGFEFFRNQQRTEILDFDRAEGDKLLLSQWMWRGGQGMLTAQQVVTLFATTSPDGDTTLDFGAANTVVVLRDYDDLAGLASAIEII